MDNNEKEQLLQEALWRCTCGDDGKHTDPDYHDQGCPYILFYDLHFNLGGEDDE
jgi:hypothetical protein